MVLVMSTWEVSLGMNVRLVRAVKLSPMASDGIHAWGRKLLLITAALGGCGAVLTISHI